MMSVEENMVEDGDNFCGGERAWAQQCRVKSFQRSQEDGCDFMVGLQERLEGMWSSGGIRKHLLG